jgi:hypothetical protein
MSASCCLQAAVANSTLSSSTGMVADLRFCCTSRLLTRSTTARRTMGEASRLTSLPVAPDRVPDPPQDRWPVEPVEAKQIQFLCTSGFRRRRSRRSPLRRGVTEAGVCGAVVAANGMLGSWVKITSIEALSCGTRGRGACRWTTPEAPAAGHGRGLMACRFRGLRRVSMVLWSGRRRLSIVLPAAGRSGCARSAGRRSVLRPGLFLSTVIWSSVVLRCTVGVSRSRNAGARGWLTIQEISRLRRSRDPNWGIRRTAHVGHDWAWVRHEAAAPA